MSSAMNILPSREMADNRINDTMQRPVMDQWTAPNLDHVTFMNQWMALNQVYVTIHYCY